MAPAANRRRWRTPAAGLEVAAIDTRAWHNRSIDAQAERGIEVTRRFLEESDRVDDEAAAWAADLRELDAAGAFLTASVQFRYLLRRPG